METNDPLRNFILGVTTTTRGSWIGMVLFALAEVGLCCFLFQPSRLARLDRHYLMSSARDEYADISFRLITLRNATKMDVPHVSFVGASNATRSLVAHDDDTMSRELVAAYGRPARFDVFSANNERYEDWLQIAEQFPKDYRGVLIVETHDMKDDYHGDPMKLVRARRRLALPSTPQMDRIWATQGIHYPQSGLFFLDHLGFFSARRQVAFRLMPAPNTWKWTGTKTPSRFRTAVARYQKLTRAIDAGKNVKQSKSRSRAFIESRRVLKRIVAIMKARKSDVLFVQAPVFPPRYPAYGDRIEQFTSDMKEFCEEVGCYAWNTNDDISFETNDFQDSIHVNSKKKRREITDKMLAKVAAILDRQNPPSEGAATETETGAMDAGTAEPDSEEQ